MITVVKLAGQILAALLDVIATLAKQQAQLDRIEAAVSTEPAPAGVVITLTEGMKTAMKAKLAKASLDFTLLDNGTGTATLSFVDSLQEPTVAPAGSTVTSSFSSSSPQVSVTGAADGMSAALAAVVNPGDPLQTGIIVSVSTTITLADGTTVLGPFAAQGAPIDIIAGGPAGVQLVEA